MSEAYPYLCFLLVAHARQTRCEITPDSGRGVKFTYRVMETAETGNNFSLVYSLFHGIIDAVIFLPLESVASMSGGAHTLTPRLLIDL